MILGAAPPLLLDPGERLELLGEAGVAWSSSSTSTRPSARPSTTPSWPDHDADAPRRAPDDAGRGVRPRPARDAGDRRRARRSDGFEVVVVPPFEIDGAPVGARTSGRRSRRATWPRPPGCSAGRTRSSGTGRASDAAGTSVVTFAPPREALPPDGPGRPVLQAPGPDAMVDAGGIEVRTSGCPPGSSSRSPAGGDASRSTFAG